MYYEQELHGGGGFNNVNGMDQSILCKSWAMEIILHNSKLKLNHLKVFISNVRHRFFNMNLMPQNITKRFQDKKGHHSVKIIKLCLTSLC